jgi:acyl-[acyl-carrier-protein] desaturase
MPVVTGVSTTNAPDTLGGFAYVAFQELATRIAHRITGRYSDDPVADRIRVWIASGADRMSR